MYHHRTACSSPCRSLFRPLGKTLVLLSVILVLPGCGNLSLPGGSDAVPGQDDEPKTIAVTLATEKLELFMEHPYLVQDQGAKFNVHLTVLDDGMPILDGKITVVATGPSGKTVTVEQPGPRSPGIFGPVVPFPEPGENEMALILQSAQATDTIRVPVMVYPDDASAKTAADAVEEEEPEGKITFLKEQAWKIRVLIQPVVKRRLVKRLLVPGQIVPRAGAKAVVTTPIAGRVLPPTQAPFPQVGQHVEAGAIVAIIDAPIVGPTGVGMLANQVQLQTFDTDLAVKLRDIEVEIARMKIDLDYAKVTLDRIRSVTAGGGIAGKRLKEAERQYELAKASYEGKLQAGRIYQSARENLSSMLHAGDLSQQSAASPATSSRITLRAPISGTVTAAQVTQGEFVDVTKSLFTIINMEQVWLEAKVSEFDLIQVTKAPAANFSLGAYPDRTFAILGRDGGKLIDVGSVVDTQSRTLTVRYEISNPDRLFRIGMFADVAIETAVAEETLAIPESAVVDEDGLPTAYVQLDGEAFQRRDLELGIADGG